MLSSFSCIALSMFLLKKGIHSLLVSLSFLLRVLLCLNLDQGLTERARTRSQTRAVVVTSESRLRRHCGLQTPVRRRRRRRHIVNETTEGLRVPFRESLPHLQEGMK